MKKFCFLFVAILMYSKSFAGIQTNGGDAISAEFLAIFDGLYLELSQLDLDSDGAAGSKILNAMKEKRALLELRSSPELSIDNVPKDAVNYPELNPPLIEVSQKSWARLSRVQKSQLVIHEILPIAGYSDRDYALSSWFINKTYLGEDRNDEIEDIFKLCKTSSLKTITLFELKRIFNQGQMPLPQIAGKGFCIEGLRLLIQAGWDLNLCPVGDANTLELTTLAQISIYFPRGFRESIKNFNEFESLLLDHGATRTCSGYYKNSPEASP